jgi:hypothetical protein
MDTRILIDVIVSPILNGLCVIAAAYFFSGRFAKKSAHITVQLEFTRRLHAIMAEKAALERSIKSNAVRLDFVVADAREIYRQLFGLLLDEMDAYVHDLLTEESFINWLMWRTKLNRFEIAGVGYLEAMRYWFDTWPHESPFHHFLESLYECTDLAGIRVLVRRYRKAFRRRGHTVAD